MIAVWPSAPPWVVARPTMRPGSINAVSAGVSSTATTTLPLGRGEAGPWRGLVRLRTRRAATSRTSSRRAAK